MDDPTQSVELVAPALVDGQAAGPAVEDTPAASSEIPFYDAATEEALDRWVEAKRRKDFQSADAIRGQLRVAGIDVEKARPPMGQPGHKTVIPCMQAKPEIKPLPVPPPAPAYVHVASASSGAIGPPEMPAIPAESTSIDGVIPKYDALTEDALDRWVEAKRKKDFATADAIRNQLRTCGVDVEKARPPMGQPGHKHWVAGCAPGRGPETPSVASASSYMLDPNAYMAMYQATYGAAAYGTTPTQPYNAAATPYMATMAATVPGMGATVPGMGPTGLALAVDGTACMQQMPTMLPTYAAQPLAAPVPQKTLGKRGRVPSLRTGPEYDDETEEQLDEWCTAKRSKDFAKADQIRALLRTKGVNPDLVRPAIK
mmetsp:Transcript_28885/g.47906  ORF Transcript_28885/g.47906 Transcript_28885/m.47906 type:complete len:371 (+) Transcript_28885:53-1165(+)